jgi:hypothetical protein
MDQIDWKAWLQIIVAAVGTVGGPTAALAAMLGSGVLQLDADVEENRALAAQWFAFLQKIVDEKRDPTEEEHAQARAFADQVHADVQSG